MIWTPWQCPMASKSNKGSSWYSPINTQKSSRSASGGWEDANHRAEGLYPSTINKVHHGGYEKPLAWGELWGETTITTPQRMVNHFLQPACWLLRLSLLLCFLSTMELVAVKKEILGGLGRKRITKSQELADTQ